MGDSTDVFDNPIIHRSSVRNFVENFRVSDNETILRTQRCRRQGCHEKQKAEASDNISNHENSRNLVALLWKGT